MRSTHIQHAWRRSGRHGLPCGIVRQEVTSMTIDTRVACPCRPACPAGALAAALPTSHANVARFQRLPAPQGQTFTVQADQSAESRRARIRHLCQRRERSSRPARLSPGRARAPADMIVQLGYGVDQGQQSVTTTPGFGGYGGCGGGWGGFGGGFGGMAASVGSAAGAVAAGAMAGAASAAGARLRLPRRRELHHLFEPC